MTTKCDGCVHYTQHYLNATCKECIANMESNGGELIHYEASLPLPAGVTLDVTYQPAKSALDKQVGGGHYKDYKIQPVEFIVGNNIGFREGNAIKYICRHQSKNGKQDIEKAIHYLEMILEDYDSDKT